MTTEAHRRTVTPYLSVRGGEAAMEFYRRAFGAEKTGEKLVMPDGQIAHAEMQIGDGSIFLSDENEDWGNRSPLAIGDTPVRIAIQVEDADAAFARAEEAGCEVLIPLADQFYGHRSGRLRDPFGHVWIVSQVVEELTEAEIQARLDAMMAQQ